MHPSGTNTNPAPGRGTPSVEIALREWVSALDAVPDLIFMHDADGLILRANLAYAGRAGANIKDIIGKHYWDVFPELPCPQNPQQHARQNRIDGDCHIRLDTGEIFSMRTFPVHDSHGAYLYSMCVLNDITAQIVAQKAAQASEFRYRSLFENMLDGFAYCKMLYKNNQPQDFIYLDVNAAFEQLTGLKNVIGKKVSEVIPGIRESNPELFDIYGGVATSGKPERFETYVAALDIWFSISVYRPEEGCFIAVFDNITDRKRAVEALRISESRYHQLFESSRDGIVLLNTATLKVEDVNSYLANMLGYTREEFLGKTPGEACPFSDAGLGEKIFLELRQKGYIHYDGIPLRTKHGTQIEIELAGNTYFYEGVNVIQCNIRDITDRALAERALRTVDRARKVLSKGNSTLIHAQNEQELLNEVCRVIIDTGGYRMVWVGFAEQDKAKTVRPVAVHGHEDGYLDTVRISWAETGQDHDPTGTAIRTGHSQFVQDVATGPRTAQWRGEALKRDYKSTIALPLRHASGTLGALTLYTTEKNAFSSDEVAMLQELADDLAFGIITLRTRLEHRHHQEILRTSLVQSIQAIAAMVEQRDPYTAGHQRRVASLCDAIARELDLSEDRIQGLHLAATIHDLGKIQTPAEILSKPGRLNPVEFELVKMHSLVGYEIMKDVSFPWPIAQIILQHHEHLDGTGYPHGIKGDLILLESRILTVADVVEAIASHRPYRPALGIEKAIEEINSHAGTYYDTAVVETCARLVTEQGFRFE